MNEITKEVDKSLSGTNMTQKEMLEHFEYYKNPNNRMTPIADKWEVRVYFCGLLALISFFTLFITYIIGANQEEPPRSDEIFMSFFSFSILGIIFFSGFAFICNEMKNKHNKTFNYFESSHYEGNLLDLFSGADAELFFEMEKNEIIERIESRNRITGELLLWIYDSIQDSYTIDILRQQKKAKQTVNQLKKSH